jgi:transcriptional regulator with XRE-family HTH domain
MPSTKSTDPIDVHVGSRVRGLRLKHGMSQEKLGAQLGITFQQVQKYEKGTNRISASRPQQIAQIFGVEPAHFFDEKARGSSARKRAAQFPIMSPLRNLSRVLTARHWRRLSAASLTQRCGAR